MTRVGNVILIVLLTGGLLAAVTFVAIQSDPPQAQPVGESMEMLIVQLGDDDEATWKAAEAELRRLGEQALPHLERATRSADAMLATRSRRLFDKLTDPAGGVD